MWHACQKLASCVTTSDRRLGSYSMNGRTKYYVEITLRLKFVFIDSFAGLEVDILTQVLSKFLGYSDKSHFMFFSFIFK